MRLIALCGYKGAGKTTAARALVEGHGFVRVRFAEPLRAMLRALGLDQAELDGDLKDSPCLKLGGRSPAYAMMTLGTEWGRDLIHPDLWVWAWGREIRAAERAGARRIVADDLRFPNELAAVRALGGEVWKIERHGTGPNGHNSEAHVAGFGADLVILNAADLAAFRGQVSAAAGIRL